MKPDAVAARLLARQGQPDFHQQLAELSFPLALETIAALKRRVDDAKLRNAHHALQIAEVAQAVATHSTLPEAQALALWARGNALYHLSRYQEALTCYQRAESLYAEQGKSLEVAGLQLNQVAVLQDMSDFQTALSLAAQARAICQEVGAPAQRYLAILEMNVGAAYQQIGDLAAALAAYDRGRALLTALDEVVETARIDINRANVLQEMGRFDAAAALYQTARAVLAETGHDQEVARADHNLGKLAYRRGQYQAALRFLEAAHSGFAAIPNPTEVATVNLYRSFVYRDLNLLQETISLAAAAEPTFKRESAHWMRAMSLINQGIGYQRLGVYPLAEQLLVRARRLLWRQGAYTRVVALDVDRATLALEAGRSATAQRLARRVERQFDPDTWPALTARTHILLARCALARAQPNPTVALRHAAAARSIAETYDLPESAAAAHALGGAYEAAGDLPAAWQQYQAALYAIESLRARLPLDDLRMGFMDDKLPMYAAAVRLGLHFASPAQVLAALNLAHTAPLARLSPSLTEPAPSDADLRTRLQTLRETWHWYQSKLEDIADLHADPQPERRASEMDVLRQNLRDLEAEIADLVRRRQVRTSASMPVGTTPAPPSALLEAAAAETFRADLQQRLGPRAVLLHYFVSADQFGAAVLTSDDLHLVPNLVAAAALQRVLRSWRFQLEHGPARVSPQARRQTATAHLSRLYQALVAPLEPYLTACEHVFLVIPPGWHDLPFAALFDGQAYLVERWQLTYLSAPEVLLHSAPTSFVPGHTGEPHALIVGYSENGRLPHTVVEARQVALALQSNMPTTCWMEDAATIAHLRAGIQTSHLLHLATHALFRPDNPFFSWMRLADARLTVADLYELTLPQRPLVVLSACETGRGQPRGGGLWGMGRGFLAAGAAGLIVSLWKIEDQAAAQVMADLYTHLLPMQARIAPSAALCQAQRLACARGEHPFGWASFIFIQG